MRDPIEAHRRGTIRAGRRHRSRRAPTPCLLPEPEKRRPRRPNNPTRCRAKGIKVGALGIEPGIVTSGTVAALDAGLVNPFPMQPPPAPGPFLVGVRRWQYNDLGLIGRMGRDLKEANFGPKSLVVVGGASPTAPSRAFRRLKTVICRPTGSIPAHSVQPTESSAITGSLILTPLLSLGRAPKRYSFLNPGENRLASRRAE